MAGPVLVVDDDPLFAHALLRSLGQRGLQSRWLTHGTLTAAALAEDDYDVAVIDSARAADAGLEVLALVRARSPRVRVVMTDASATVESAVAAMRRGAADFWRKPADTDALAQTVLELVRQPVAASPLTSADGAEVDGPDSEIVGDSPAMRAVLGLIARVSPAVTPVLISGESGTGKELVARTIHRRSPRSGRRFIPLNCGALPEGLIDSELFGHVRGAFTGARSQRQGLFQEADGGTLFLDEIASTSMAFQARLLRVLEDGQVRPVGANRSRVTDTRIIAASNADLRVAVREGRFRADLYYRLDVVHLTLPPLRERGGDVEQLARRFAENFARNLGRGPVRWGPDFVECLQRHPWPGNVRELRNAIERAVLLADGDLLSGEQLRLLDPVALAPTGDELSYAQAKRRALHDFTLSYVGRLLERSRGNVSRAASIAGIPRQTLHRLMRSLADRSGR